MSRENERTHPRCGLAKIAISLLLSARAVHAAFCCFLHFAQRVFCAARIFAIAAADILRFLGAVVLIFLPLSLAQRAR